MIDRCNIIIVGGGLTGIALGAQLAGWDRKVWILDQEEISPAHSSWLALTPWDPIGPGDEDTARLSRAGAALWEKIPGAMKPKGALHLFDSGSLLDAGERWVRGLRAPTGIQQLEAW